MIDNPQPDSGRSSSILLHYAKTALLYEELRSAIDGGHESMTHADALAEISAIRAENETLSAGYAAARLEIASLRAAQQPGAAGLVGALEDAQPPIPSAAVALSDDLRDRLVAISEAVADQDDRAAQAMLREILAAPQPSSTPQADSQPAAVRDYPPLPRVGAIGYASVVDIESYAKTLTIGPHLPGVRDIALWTTDQMRAYVDADRAARAQADSVLEDAARLDWLLLHISGAEFRRIGVHYSGNASRADVDAARKQGANHD